MTEKIFRTQIKLRYDTLDNWTTADPILLVGEVAVVVMPSTVEGGTPSVLLKVGDGVSNFSALPFITAKAGDVHEWAKAETKPTYAAEEIEGLEDYINDTIQDTNTKYQIIQGADAKTFKFQSKELEDEGWTDAFELHIPDDITYTITSEAPGKVTFTPSVGDVQQITVIEIETDKTKIDATNDKLPTAAAVSGYVEDALSGVLDELNVEDAAATGEFVTEVKQTDGKIEVQRKKLEVSDISDLEFNSSYDKENNKVATMADVDQAASRVLRFKGNVATVPALPETGNEVGDVWHVKSTKAEYVWVEREDEESGETIAEWEKMGNDMDLSAYATKEELDDALALKQDLITETNKLSVDLVNGTATQIKDGLMSAEDKTKLDSLEEGAQENIIEKVIAGDAIVPIEDKTITLSKVAYTGNVYDLIQDDDNVLILDGGNALGMAPIEETASLILNGGTSSRD